MQEGGAYRMGLAIAKTAIATGQPEAHAVRITFGGSCEPWVELSPGTNVGGDVLCVFDEDRTHV
jgi:hypothetical protein